MPHAGHPEPDDSGSSRFTTRRLARFADPDLIGAIRLGLLHEHGQVDPRPEVEGQPPTEDRVVVTMADRRARRARLRGEE